MKSILKIVALFCFLLLVTAFTVSKHSRNSTQKSDLNTNPYVAGIPFAKIIS
jgi:hypothetical protein